MLQCTPQKLSCQRIGAQHGTGGTTGGSSIVAHTINRPGKTVGNAVSVSIGAATGGADKIIQASTGAAGEIDTAGDVGAVFSTVKPSITVAPEELASKRYRHRNHIATHKKELARLLDAPL